MKSIAIIIPYFGKFPTIFPFWKQSAFNNPSIHFIFFTDNNDLVSENNIEVIHMSFLECKKYIQRQFNFPIILSSPYKLCNFRPAYGAIFNDYIKEYDFWGFGDVDLIYGNLRSFISEEILNKYDYISGWGHLTLIRNCEYWNNFYKTELEGFQYFKDVFSSNKLSRFDEYLNKGIGDLAKKLHEERVWDTRPFDDVCIPAVHLDFYSVFHPEVSNHLIFAYDNNNLWRLYINNGEIKKEPIEYAHFQRRANLRIRANNTQRYLIIPNSIIEYKLVNIEDILKWGKPRNLENLVRKGINRILRILKIKYQFIGGY